MADVLAVYHALTLVALLVDPVKGNSIAYQPLLCPSYTGVTIGIVAWVASWFCYCLSIYHTQPGPWV